MKQNENPKAALRSSAVLILLLVFITSACMSSQRLPEEQERFFQDKYLSAETFEYKDRTIYSPYDVNSEPTPLFSYDSPGLMLISPGERPRGSVTLGMIVNTKGKTEFIVPLKVTGKKMDPFVDTVIRHYKERSFIPAVKGGEGVASMMIVRQKFNPDDDS